MEKLKHFPASYMLENSIRNSGRGHREGIHRDPSLKRVGSSCNIALDGLEKELGVTL